MCDGFHAESAITKVIRVLLKDLLHLCVCSTFHRLWSRGGTDWSATECLTFCVNSHTCWKTSRPFLLKDQVSELMLEGQKKSSQEQEKIHMRSFFSLVWAFPQDWKDTRSGRSVFIAVMSCWTVGQTSQSRSSGWLFSSILGHLSARHAYYSSCTDPHALMVRMNVNYHTWFRWVLPDCRLVQSNCVFFVLNCSTNTSLQEPWIGIAWWRWSCRAGPCGKWPMPSIYSLVTRTWRISPISRCWPFWRSLSVSVVSTSRLTRNNPMSVRRPALFEHLSSPPSSCSSAVACGQRGPAPGALWELTVLQHSR